MEVAYFNHGRTNAGSNNSSFADYNSIPSESRQYLNDADIVYYHYSYKLTYYPESVSTAF
jgi:hypothetical protein